MPFISNGTTMLNNGAIQANLGSLTLISTNTGSNVSSINITSGIDSTYPIYMFEVTNLRSASGANLLINFSSDGGSNYNVTKTTTAFVASNHEPGGEAPGSHLTYSSGYDLAQSSSDLYIATINKGGIHTGTDGGIAGNIFLYEPSSTTYVKHFQSRIHSHSEYPGASDCYVAGYLNTTSAVNAVTFKALAQNCYGTIKLYGIKDS
tara:strand:- start:1537 stop:2154 length:618 start_codon:yes stop_codon:yes gene_type:complete